MYGIGALGWRGSARHWQRYQSVYILLAGLAAPLVVSVHSTVGMDFAAGETPGWHTTIMPPYFVAGAIFSGFAMVLTIAIPLRKFYNLEDFITLRHIENSAKLMLVTGMIVFYGYTMEWVMGWYSGNTYEWFMNVNRAVGPYAPYYWALILCNCILPQLLWFKPVRQNLAIMWLITIEINIGMWLERFVIVVISLHRDFMVSNWGILTAPPFWDWATFIGTLGFFFSLRVHVRPRAAGHQHLRDARAGAPGGQPARAPLKSCPPKGQEEEESGHGNVGVDHVSAPRPRTIDCCGRR